MISLKKKIIICFPPEAYVLMASNIMLYLTNDNSFVFQLFHSKLYQELTIYHVSVTHFNQNLFKEVKELSKTFLEPVDAQVLYVLSTSYIVLFFLLNFYFHSFTLTCLHHNCLGEWVAGWLDEIKL